MSHQHHERNVTTFPFHKAMPLADITATPECQPRAKINEDLVKEYEEAMLRNASFPPLKVCFDGKDYWLYDGYHRRLAAIKAKRDTFPVEVTDGTHRDAILLSLQQNAVHGLRRTNADKRRAVETLLNDHEWSQWSNREIARQAAVEHKLVNRLRDSISGAKPQIDQAPRTATRQGKVYTINTANNFMQVSCKFGDQMSDFLTFKPSVLYALAAPSNRPPPSAARNRSEVGSSSTTRQATARQETLTALVRPGKGIVNGGGLLECGKQRGNLKKRSENEPKTFPELFRE